jgi:hypothetical protein
MAYSSYDGVPSKMFYIYVGFEVMTAVVMKSYIFWDITSCSLLKVNRRNISPPSSRSKKEPSGN